MLIPMPIPASGQMKVHIGSALEGSNIVQSGAAAYRALDFMLGDPDSGLCNSPACSVTPYRSLFLSRPLFEDLIRLF